MGITTKSTTLEALIASIRAGQNNLVHELDINDSLYAVKDKAVDALAGTVATITSDIVDLDSRLTTLSSNANLSDTAVAGQYVSSVSQSNGAISVTRAALPTVAEISETGKAIISVSQTNGTIAATAGNVAAAHVTVADADNKFTGENVEAVLVELEGKIATLSGVNTDTLSKIQQIIKEISAGDGENPTTSAQAWVTLIDKLKDLSINGEDKTVKQYVDYYVDALQTSITGLGGRLDTAEGNITSLGGRLDTAESDIDSLDTRLTTAEGNITTINSTIESNERVTAAALTDLNSRLNATSHTHNADVTFNDWAISYVIDNGAEKLVFTPTSKTAAGSLTTA